MPNLPISQLPELAASGITPNTEYAVVQGGVTYKVKQGTLTPYPVVVGFFSQTGSTANLSGTSEQSIIGPGTGTLSVAANQFRVGDTFSVYVSGHLSNNNDSLQFRVKSDSVILADSGMVNYNTSGDEVNFSMEITFQILAIGGPGSASIQTRAFWKTVKNSNFTVNGYSFESTNNTTFDTTDGNNLDITIEFDNTNPSTYLYTEMLVLDKLY